MALDIITSETRLNSVSVNPTLDNSPVTVMEVNKVIVEVNKILDGTESITEVVVGNGTEAAPSMTFASDQDTGIYRIGANNIGITANGAKVIDIATTGLGVTGALTVSSTTDSTTKDTGSIITEGGLGVEKNINAGGTIKNADTTDSTTKDTGAIVTEGGLGVEKAIFAGTTINAGTALTVGTDQTFAKEVNHNISVAASTTADTAGGNINKAAGAGLGTGAGGNNTNVGGAGGATGVGGNTVLRSGAGGATSGASGDTNIDTGDATVGGTGDVNINTGNTASGLAGDIILETGVGTSTTVVPVISLNKAVVKKPASNSVASGGTITGVELVRGLIAATGAVGSWQLPSAADITTAIGATPAGTNFEFIFNAAAMTATDTATLVVGAGMSVMSAPAITGGGTLTVTQDTQVVGLFRIIFDTPTTCKISRIV